MRRRASEGETVGVDEPSNWSVEGQEAPRGALSAGGHATVSITLDTYSHAIPAMQEEAAVRIAELVFAAK